jgi:hypothetical protein
MKAFLTYKSLNLPAYAVVPMAVSGSVFVCKSSTAIFYLSLDGGEEFPIEQGWSINLQGDEGFRNLIFHNRSGAAIAIEFYAGSSVMYYASQDTVFYSLDPATYAKAGAVNIDAGATIEYAGTDGAGGNVRRQIVITNLDVNLDLQVLDKDGTLCATVFPRSAWTIETSGKVSVKNNNGAAMSINIAETFYA